MKPTKKPCDLQSCSFCSLCHKEWLPLIDANRQTLQVKSGEEFIREGEKLTGIYFVYQGTVKVHKKWGEKELIVRFAKKGDIVGHRGLGNDLHYPVSATAIESAIICFIGIGFFQSSLKVNQEYLFHLLMFFADELKLSERKMRDLAHMPAKGRVAQALLALQEKFGTRENGFIDLSLSRNDLASYTAATYETVFRVLNELVNEELITLSGRNIQIIDSKKLELAIKLPSE